VGNDLHRPSNRHPRVFIPQAKKLPPRRTAQFFRSTIAPGRSAIASIPSRMPFHRMIWSRGQYHVAAFFCLGRERGSSLSQVFNKIRPGTRKLEYLTSLQRTDTMLYLIYNQIGQPLS
jgi:hypothetical protein